MSETSNIVIRVKGLTIKELKDLLKDWPEVNETTGENYMVFMETGFDLEGPVNEVLPMIFDGYKSKDILFRSHTRPVSRDFVDVKECEECHSVPTLVVGGYGDYYGFHCISKKCDPGAYKHNRKHPEWNIADHELKRKTHSHRFLKNAKEEWNQMNPGGKLVAKNIRRIMDFVRKRKLRDRNDTQNHRHAEWVNRKRTQRVN